MKGGLPEGDECKPPGEERNLRLSILSKRQGQKRKGVSKVRTNKETTTKQRWEPMKLSPVGHISRVIQGGGGKLTTCPGDPGEPRKPSGGGGEPGGCKA